MDKPLNENACSLGEQLATSNAAQRSFDSASGSAQDDKRIKALRMEGFWILESGPYFCTGSNMTSVRNWMAVSICSSVSS